MKFFILKVIKFILYPYWFMVLSMYWLTVIIIDILLSPLVFVYRLSWSDDKYFYFLDNFLKD